LFDFFAAPAASIDDLPIPPLGERRFSKGKSEEKIFPHKIGEKVLGIKRDAHLKRCPSTESSRVSRLALCTSTRTRWSVNPR
jgi:hypothetical protein